MSFSNAAPPTTQPALFRRQAFLRVDSSRRLPIQHLLLRNLQQIIAVLNQQVQRMRNVRNVLNIRVFETEAMQGFEEVGRGADALDGGFEDVFGVGFGVDEQRWAFGNIAVEGEIAVLQRFNYWHMRLLRLGR